MAIDERELGALVREIAPPPIDPVRRAELRAAVLRAAETRPAAGARVPVRVAAGFAMAAAAGLVAWMALRGDAETAAQKTAAPERAAPERAAPELAAPELAAPPPRAPPHRATVQSSSSADFQHTARWEGGVNDEVVRLRAGRVSVAVERLAPAERFRVVAGDGEVEVRGTAFDVVVVGDRLASVEVHHGLVEVRVRGDVVAVRGGERWSRETSTPQPPPAPAPPARTKPRVRSTPETASASPPASESMSPPAPAPAAPPPAASSTELAFRAGRDALRDGDFGRAAEQFQRAIATDPAAPLAEDARYWRGVALARAGRDLDARGALAEFLARHPRSAHAGRASIVLGNLLLAARELDAARGHFEAALADPDPAVRAAAARALGR